MAETLDQIFVALKTWLVSFAPGQWQPLVSAVISVAAIIGTFASLFALTTVLERKGLGRIQNRYGPNRVGPYGILQPLADGVKALTKEDVVPRKADRVVHFLAPLVLVVPVFLALAVLPVGRNMVAVDLDAGLLFFFAVGAVTELSVFMAGDAGDCANDQLRSAADPFVGDGGDAGGHVVHGGDRGAAGGLHSRIGRLECVHTVGVCGFYFVYDRGGGGIEPVAI